MGTGMGGMGGGVQGMGSGMGGGMAAGMGGGMGGGMNSMGGGMGNLGGGPIAGNAGTGTNFSGNSNQGRWYSTAYILRDIYTSGKGNV